MASRGVEWATGVFEGEGCISVRKPKGRYRQHVTLVVGSKDADVISELLRVFGVGKVYPAKGRMTRWECFRRDDVVNVLEAMLPYLCERRRARAIEALGHLAAPDGRKNG